MTRKIIILLILGLTFGCRAQSQKQRLTKYKALIIGTWISQEDSSYKIEFTRDNKLKIFIDNNLEEMTTYEITTSCNSNSSNYYDIFLKIQIDSTSYNCDILRNIITESSSKTILSITTERGQLEKYIKQ
ncbi:hypothetical protein IU405_09720 [Polaribacter sp. BAL334]|uniref:hypothetical protein n=1 Tax=Polaribacter sp. BAL334 TaxID=1708178 RepID=UPI0018D1F7B3|nr:hypothetical protein [Polaribacter sp. BAL334]MBG7612522.1 hypothetical protein [Polaribacter sp. BAL334]